MASVIAGASRSLGRSIEVVNHPNRSKTKPRIEKVCAFCGSDAIVIDATAIWNCFRQQWEAIEFHDTNNAYCSNCDGETRLENREIVG